MSNDGYLQSVKKQFSYYKALAEKLSHNLPKSNYSGNITKKATVLLLLLNI